MVVKGKTLTAADVRREFNASDKMFNRFVTRVNKELDAERKARRSKLFTGKLKRS
jgi:uncharacterized protein YeaO (DUF488 family)